MVGPGRELRRPRDRWCHLGTVPVCRCLQGDHKGCNLRGTARACNIRDVGGATHRHKVTVGVCQGSRRFRLVAGPENLAPHILGLCLGRGHAGHEQRDERHRQPGHPQLREDHTEWGLAVLLRDLQGLPGLQEEVRFLPCQLPLWYTVEGASTAVPRDVPAGEDRNADQEGRDHGVRLNALCKDESAFIKDLMQEITNRGPLQSRTERTSA